MAVLETIRVKFGVLITVLIAVALLSFIIDPTTLQNVASSMSSKYDVGEIDGKSISYTDYQKDVKKTKGVMELLGFQANSEQAQSYVRDEAWKELFDKYYFIPNAESAGIYVGDQEALDLISGDNISPVIAQMFSDENGFNREAFLNFVDYCRADQTGRYKELLNYLCNAAISQQYYSKYFSLFSASNITNELDLRKEIADNNNSVNAEFVMVPFGFAKDTTVQVSDDEIKAWYKSHKNVAAYKDLLTRKASRDIEYVVYDILPSAEDIAEANNEIASLVEDFANTSNVKSFLSANYCSFDEKYYKEGELKSIAPEVDEFVFNNGGKNISGVLAHGTDFYVVRILDTKKEDGVVKKQVAVLKKESVAGKATVNEIYSRARDFANQAGNSYKDFRAAVDSQSVYAHSANLLEGASRIGSLENAKEITRWAYEAKKGDVSEIFDINKDYFVVAVLKGINKEGFKDVSEVSSTIREILYSQKIGDVKAAEVAGKIAGLSDMSAIAEALGTTVSTKEGITFSSLTSQGLDPAFIGAVTSAEEGVISAPVKGSFGIYVFKVTGKETGAHYTEDDAANKTAQMNQYLSQMLMASMTDEVVTDNRARFY